MKVGLFIPCYIDAFFPEVGIATLELLERLGCSVEFLHDAYGRINLTASPYGVFLAGPSATGDTEGVIIHGAQGARSLTVLLFARQALGGGVG